VQRYFSCNSTSSSVCIEAFFGDLQTFPLALDGVYEKEEGHTILTANLVLCEVEYASCTWPKPPVPSLRMS
jgi:hypothetical protein